MVVPTLLYTHFFPSAVFPVPIRPPSSTLYTGIHSLRGATFNIQHKEVGMRYERGGDPQPLFHPQRELSRPLFPHIGKSCNLHTSPILSSGSPIAVVRTSRFSLAVRLP